MTNRKLLHWNDSTHSILLEHGARPPLFPNVDSIPKFKAGIHEFYLFIYLFQNSSGMRQGLQSVLQKFTIMTAGND